MIYHKIINLAMRNWYDILPFKDGTAKVNENNFRIIESFFISSFSPVENRVKIMFISK